MALPTSTSHNHRTGPRARRCSRGRTSGFKKARTTAALFAAAFFALPLAKAAPAGPPSTATIIITQEDLDRFERAEAATNTTSRAKSPSEKTATEPSAAFESCRSFPYRDFIYWHWLESGELGVIARIENQIAEQRRELRAAAEDRSWSEQQQRRLDRAEDEIERLESSREQALLDRIAELELAAPSPTVRRRRAVLYTALALVELKDGRAKDAVEALGEASRHLPGEPLITALRGIAFREAGDNEAAVGELRSALAENPRLLLAQIALAQSHEDRLEFDEAAKLWERIGREKPSFPHAVERWADRERSRFPNGIESLRRNWSDYVRRRLRLARLRDFAHKYYPTSRKAAYLLIYDPSIGTAKRDESVETLKNYVALYLEGGEQAVESDRIEQLFRTFSRRNDPAGFDNLFSYVTDALDTAERDVDRALGHRPRRRPVVVLYNPATWETLIADRSALGLFAPHGRSIGLCVEPTMSPAELKNTIYHEYGHFVMFDATGPRRLPLWLVEGVAEFAALASGYDRYAEDPVLAHWRPIWAKQPIGRPWFDKGPESFSIGDYYKSRRAIELIVARFGRRGLADFLDELGGGADLDEASRKAFGIKYRELLRFLVKRLPSWNAG